MFNIGKKFKSTTRDSFILVKDFLSSFNEYQDSNANKSLALVVPAPPAPDANEADNNDAAPAPSTEAAAPKTGLLSSFFG